MGIGVLIANSRCSGKCRCVALQTGQCSPTEAKSCQNRSPQLRQTAVNISKPPPLFPASKQKCNAVTIKHVSHMTCKYGSNLFRFSRDSPDFVWVSNNSVLVSRKIRFETQYVQGFFSPQVIQSFIQSFHWLVQNATTP
jgi:hypothetical protein